MVRHAFTVASAVLLSISLLASCGDDTSSGPTAEAPTTTTPTTIATTTTEAGEVVTGSVFNAYDHSPLVGVAVVLCVEDGVDGCAIDLGYSAVTDAGGLFEIRGVPDGTHALLYSLVGVDEKWDGMHGTLDPLGGITREDIIDFLGVDDLRSPWIQTTLDGSGPTGVSAFAYSPGLELGFVWVKDGPLSVEVSGLPASIEFPVWDTENMPATEDFEEMFP